MNIIPFRLSYRRAKVICIKSSKMESSNLKPFSELAKGVRHTEEPSLSDFVSRQPALVIGRGLHIFTKEILYRSRTPGWIFYRTSSL